MYQVINTRVDTIYEKFEKFTYIYKPDAPRISPFDSKIVGEWLNKEVLQALQLREQHAKNIEIGKSFIGSFKPDFSNEMTEFHYLVFNNNNFSKETCFILKANQSPVRPDIFDWSFAEINADHEITFEIESFGFKYEDLLCLYFLNPKFTEYADNFYNFVSQNEKVIIHNSLQK